MDPIMSFDIVLEKSKIANGEYRYSTGVPYEISSMARPFDDKRTLARRGRKPKCVHPVHQRGMNSTNWWVWSWRRSIDKLRAQSQWPFLLHWPYSFVARFANKLEFFPLARATMKTMDVCRNSYASCITLYFVRKIPSYHDNLSQHHTLHFLHL